MGGLTRVALALALLPLVVSAVALVIDVGAGYQPTNDLATTELHTRDVGHHPVLVGLYSRDGWNHPGPALFYLLALPYRLSGSESIGLNLGALLINGLAIAGMALIARRRGGTPLLLLTLVGCGLLVRALGPDFVRSPWVPWIPVLPFGLLLFLTWSMTCGDSWALPVAAGVASFCVQTHVGYVPLAVPLLVWGGAGLMVLHRRSSAGDNRTRLRPTNITRASVIAAGVLALMWLPPLMALLFHSPGNLATVVEYFSHPPERLHTLGQGYRVVAGQFGLSPPWLTGARTANPEPTFLYSAPPPVLLVPLGLAALALCRRRRSDARRLLTIVGLALGLGVLAVARTVGVVWEYRLRWTWVLGMVAIVVVAWAAWLLVSERSRRAEARWLVPTSIAALTVLAAINVVAAARAEMPEEARSSRLAGLVPMVAAALPKGGGDVIVRATDFKATFYSGGLLLALERRGISARVEGFSGYGEHRVHRSGPVRTVLTVATNDEFDKLLARTGHRVVAYSGILSRQERAHLVQRVSALDSAHRAGRVDDVPYFSEVARLTRRLGSPVVGVFMGPTGRPR
jgi:hypothetical protein